MIKKLDHKDIETSIEIRRLFQASYLIEAKLLNVAPFDFPPLQRPLSQFINRHSEFYGFIKESELAAVVEVSVQKNVTEIDSLVVHPNYFRQGLGKQLMEFVLNTFDTEVFNIETGLGNKPAINLYQQLGFQEETQWDTEFGIRKIKLTKTK